ncbi:MAG: Fe-S oxidoreductase [Gammaproteobacteria bacterium]|nr:Fe-S oxidoreductase [Gammaproteobacteria bacterium]
MSNNQSAGGAREGGLEAPTRHPIDWKNPAFFDEEALFKELERVFDICHGCRRCFSLCHSFPTLFDAVDESPSGELDGVPREVYWQVVDHCYLCDMCYMTKCPYVPPHPWALDFPHLMLRAKAQKFERQGASFRDKLLSSTDTVGSIAGIPVVAQLVNAANRSAGARKLLESTLGVHRDAPVPEYHSDSFRRREARREKPTLTPQATPETRGRVAVFATCYCNRNEPQVDADLVAVLEHNGIPVTLVASEKCCGMPKLELGDLKSVETLKAHNIPQMVRMIDEGYDLVAAIPSCVLMFKQELPLLFPDDPDVAKVRKHIFDPFEYLMLRHKAGLLRTDFKRELGKVAYHVPCHLRVQNLGLKTRDLLKLVPGTTLEVIERCSGHDGTYAVKKEFHETSMKIGRPVMQKVEQSQADWYSSDCPMAGHQIENGLTTEREPTHPLSLLRAAYQI